MIKSKIAKDVRFNKLKQVASDQLALLNEREEIKSLKKSQESIYIDAEKNNLLESNEQAKSRKLKK